jgi:predicted DNA binding CopG/RHH family protein
MAASRLFRRTTNVGRYLDLSSAVLRVTLFPFGYLIEALKERNIRLSSKDLEAIQKRALAEGLPYQTLISSLLHKYASGRLKEV